MKKAQDTGEPAIIEEEEIDEEFKRDRKATQALINTANIIDNADAQMLSSLYQPMQRSLGFNLTQLGAITTGRALLQAVSTPLWGWLSDKFSRKIILSIGCFIWGLFTIILALLNNFWGMFFVRAITGLGLAVIVPISQSLVSDFFPISKRGKAFGMLGLTGVLGAIVGTLYATIIGELTIGILAGWQFAFITIGAISIVLGGFVLLFGKDPVRGGSEGKLGKLMNDQKEGEEFSVKVSDFKKILTNKTFLLVVLQGVAGSIPWNSIMFLIYWFEHLKYEPFLAAIAFAVIGLGAAFGNLLGGYLGDKAAKWNPDKGRIMVAQISVFSGIPMMFVIFLLMPKEASAINLVLYILVGFITGLMISWSAPAANNPIFSEIFEPEIRGTAFSVDRLFEGSIAATGTLIVGLLAEKVFWFSPPGEGQTVFDLPEHIRLSNINALSLAMLIATCVPWVICLTVYSFVYLTYPKDRDAIRGRMQLRLADLERKREESIRNKSKTAKETEETVAEKEGENDSQKGG